MLSLRHLMALLVTAAALGQPGHAHAQDDWNPFRQLDADPRPPRRAKEPPAVSPQAAAIKTPPEAADTTPVAAARPGAASGDPLPPAVDERNRGVERGELAPVMSSDGSGLPYELWRGLDTNAVEGLIGKLEIPPRSPALHQMWRRLITSEAGGNGGAEAGPRFAAVRAEALYRSGLLGDAAALISKADTSADPVAGLIATRIEVASGDATRGCERLKPAMSRKADLPKPFQMEALVLKGYCAAIGGNPSVAGLSAELAREERLVDPVALAALDAVASGNKTPARGGKTVTLLHYRLHELAGGIERADLLARGEPALLAALVTDPKSDPDLQLAAAEAAARLNALPPSTLAATYRQHAQANPPEATAPAAPPASAAKPSTGTPQSRAALFKSIEAERTPIRKVRLIRTLLDDAKRAGLYWQALEMLGPSAASLQPVPEIGWFAETGIEIGLVSAGSNPNGATTSGAMPNGIERARQWASLGGSVPGDGGLRHWQALIDLADTAPVASRGRSLASIEDLAVRGRLAPDLLHRLATVLDANDINVPIPLWEAVGRSPQPTGGYLPDTGVLSELQDAAKKKEFGRTVLLAMRTLGPGGAESANIIALGDGIRALRRAGLEADARRLSLEALFALWPRGVIN
jgi:hypothetical protein